MEVLPRRACQYRFSRARRLGNHGKGDTMAPFDAEEQRETETAATAAATTTIGLSPVAEALATVRTVPSTGIGLVTVPLTLITSILAALASAASRVARTRVPRLASSDQRRVAVLCVDSSVTFSSRICAALLQELSDERSERRCRSESDRCAAGDVRRWKQRKILCQRGFPKHS
jgi:hypothetical protein